MKTINETIDFLQRVKTEIDDAIILLEQYGNGNTVISEELGKCLKQRIRIQRLKELIDNLESE